MALLEREGPDFAARPLVTVLRGGDDRGLLYQADAGASALAAIEAFFAGAGGAAGGSAASTAGAAAPAAAGAGGAAAGAGGGASGGAAGGAAKGAPPKAVHRLAVFDARGEITHVISQLDLIRLLVSRRAELGPAASRSVTDLGLLDGRPPLVTLAPHAPTLLAFEALAKAGVTGAPVVAADGEMIANLSISDIR